MKEDEIWKKAQVSLVSLQRSTIESCFWILRILLSAIISQSKSMVRQDLLGATLLFLPLHNSTEDVG